MKCYKCGAEMVLRTARTGRYDGRKFYGCSRYPECRAIVQAIPTSHIQKKKKPPATDASDNLVLCTSCNGTGYRQIKLTPHSKKKIQTIICNNCGGKGYIKEIDVTSSGF